MVNPPTGTPSQPIGLAYLAAVLRKDGHEVKIYDFGIMDYYVNDFNPEIVGVTVPFSKLAHEAFFGWLETWKAKGKITVVGGADPTVRPEYYQKHDFIDHIVKGEGEIAFLELAKGGKMPKVLQQPFIQDLDSIPFPARDLLDLDKYFKKGAEYRNDYVYGERWTSLITSRGCPYNCIFCGVGPLVGKKFRARSPLNVLYEIEECVTKHDIRHFLIEDDNFTFDRMRAKEICKLIINANFGATWAAPNGLRADTLDAELVSLMARSGCKRIAIAPEVGDEKYRREVVGKILPNSKIENAVKLCKENGIIVDISTIIGFPDEPYWNMIKTILYARKLKKLGVDRVGIHMATPLPGSRLYDECKKKGYLVEDAEFTTDSVCMRNVGWNPFLVRQLQRLAMFWLNKSFKEKVLSLKKLIR